MKNPGSLTIKSSKTINITNPYLILREQEVLNRLYTLKKIKYAIFGIADAADRRKNTVTCPYDGQLAAICGSVFIAPEEENTQESEILSRMIKL